MVLTLKGAGLQVWSSEGGRGVMSKWCLVSEDVFCYNLSALDY